MAAPPEFITGFASLFGKMMIIFVINAVIIAVIFVLCLLVGLKFMKLRDYLKQNQASFWENVGSGKNQVFPFNLLGYNYPLFLKLLVLGDLKDFPQDPVFIPLAKSLVTQFRIALIISIVGLILALVSSGAVF